MCLVLTSGSGRFAAFRQASRAGAAGNESIGQIIRMYILEYAMIYRLQTAIYIVHDGIYLYILSWNIIYRHIPSYTVIYSDIPQTCIYTFMLSTENISVYIPPIWSNMIHIGSINGDMV